MRSWPLKLCTVVGHITDFYISILFYFLVLQPLMKLSRQMTVPVLFNYIPALLTVTAARAGAKSASMISKKNSARKTASAILRWTISRMCRADIGEVCRLIINKSQVARGTNKKSVEGPNSRRKYTRGPADSSLYRPFSSVTVTSLKSSVAGPELEPEPVEPKLFWYPGVGTGAVISYSGSAILEPKLSFY